VALVHYGSHAHRSDARPDSAHDFFVIVDDYRDAYRSLAATIGTRYRPGTAALLNRVLPPNVVAVVDPGVTPRLEAKCAVFSLRDFRRACSARAADHFARGRLFQPAQLVWARSGERRQAVVDALLEARAGSFAWGRAYLPARFDAATYCRVLLATSFAAEIRPESPERVDALLAAQERMIVPMYAPLLRWLSREGKLESVDETYAAPPVDVWTRWRSTTYFWRSKLRATLRWGKYVLLYDDWLEYILRKVARHGGLPVQLTARERRWPLLFLWPKLFRVLRARRYRAS
jgi:hypothetical protein